MIIKPRPGGGSIVFHETDDTVIQNFDIDLQGAQNVSNGDLMIAFGRFLIASGERANTRCREELRAEGRWDYTPELGWHHGKGGA